MFVVIVWHPLFVWMNKSMYAPFFSNFEQHNNNKKMNGAELSCGTCIKVEPSDPIFQLRKKKETPNYYGNAGAESQQKAAPVELKPTELTELDNKEQSATGVEEGTSKPETGDGNGEDEEDLDDFFASLS